MQEKTIAEQNKEALDLEISMLLLSALRAAPADTKSPEALLPYLDKVMADRLVDEFMALRIRRELPDLLRKELEAQAAAQAQVRRR